MVMKASKKTVFWLSILGLLIAFILVLSTISSEAGVNYYNQFGFSEDVKNNGSSWFSWSSSSQPDDRPCSSPLKVYMYDLPRKYNMGILAPGKNDDLELPWTRSSVPVWVQQAHNRQHSVEYWMMAYLLNSRGRRVEERSAVRVKDPKQADVFFVPFFSTLSLNKFGKSSKDEQYQVAILDILSKSEWYQASQGRDHVIPVHHPNALRPYREMLNQSIFIVADFGRLSKNVSRLEKDVVAPYLHVVPSYTNDRSDDPFASRETLLFFRGRVHRKADGHVRGQLAELLVNITDVRFENSEDVSEEGIKTATEGMRNSRFCLNLAGDTPSSCRLFDIIVSHCVPVTISDRIELPFEDDLDYNEFALFFSAEEATQPGFLVGALRSITKERWLQMWAKLKAVAHHFEYQHPAKQDDAVNMVFKQVQRKVSAAKLSIHRSQRLRVADWLRR